MTHTHTSYRDTDTDIHTDIYTHPHPHTHARTHLIMTYTHAHKDIYLCGQPRTTDTSVITPRYEILLTSVTRVPVKYRRIHEVQGR
jgi:hypothetical protein